MAIVDKTEDVPYLDKEAEPTMFRYAPALKQDWECPEQNGNFELYLHRELPLQAEFGRVDKGYVVKLYRTDTLYTDIDYEYKRNRWSRQTFEDCHDDAMFALYGRMALAPKDLFD